MAEIICIIGNKGGTGKTTLSHMLCQGLGLLGNRSVCVLTDTYREPLSPEGRRYLTADARSAEALQKVAEKLAGLHAWKGVIDGGGNRTEVDQKLYDLADLVLLPFRDSHEDMRTVIRDLELFPNAYALPSQWPTNTWQRDAADKALEFMLSEYKHRILTPVAALSSTKLLLQKQIPSELPTPLGNACRRIAHQVVALLNQIMAAREAAALEAEQQALAEQQAAVEEIRPLEPEQQSAEPAPEADANDNAYGTDSPAQEDDMPMADNAMDDVSLDDAPPAPAESLLDPMQQEQAATLSADEAATLAMARMAEQPSSPSYEHEDYKPHPAGHNPYGTLPNP